MHGAAYHSVFDDFLLVKALLEERELLTEVVDLAEGSVMIS